MTVIYYTEVNLICIIILLLFSNQMRYKSRHLSADDRIFKVLLWTTVIMCFSDMLAGICRGRFFTGARFLIEFSNLVYYETLSAVSFLWVVYVFRKLNIFKKYGRDMLILAIPFVVMSVVTVINPFTDWLFTIDENNLYVRNIGVYFHWVVTWGYLVTATVVIAGKMLREGDKKKRKELYPLLYFFVPPVIAAAIQMFFYGVTCSQVGITVSIVINCLAEQKRQILTDALTGLGNRYGFYKFCENYIQHHSCPTLFLMMLDIDGFKQVNDKFSHLEGDRALVDVAEAVKDSSEEINSRLLVSRYGGDEFLVAGFNCSQEEIDDLKKRLREKIEEKNRTNNYPFTLSISMGTAVDICGSSDDIERLLRTADEAMYAEKALKKKNA